MSVTAEYALDRYAVDQYNQSKGQGDTGFQTQSVLDSTVFTSSKTYFKDLVRESYGKIHPYLQFLSPVDTFIVRVHCIDRLSQEQISDLLNISQAAVSSRFKLIFGRLRILLKMPTLSPAKVREDFFELFPEELFEFAYVFYWVCSQNRVKHYVYMSQSGASNKMKRILAFLEGLVLREVSLLDEKEQRLQYLALVYIEYFRVISKKSNFLSFLFKRNDEIRAGSLAHRASILGEDGVCDFN